MTTDRDLTMAELADLLGMSKVWVRKQVAARAVPCHRRGRAVRFTPDDVAAIRAEGAQPVIAAPSPAHRLWLVSKSETPPTDTPSPSNPPPQPERPPGPSTPPPPPGPKWAEARRAA